MIRQTLWNKLKWWQRQQDGKTYFDLAKELGIPRFQMVLLMQGKDISCLTADKLCEYFDLSLGNKNAGKQDVLSTCPPQGIIGVGC